jgi:hypothetical protein
LLLSGDGGFDMSRLKDILLTLFIFLCFFPRIGYPGDEGTTAGIIFSFPVGAKATALAEAYTAAEDDALSLYYNPAALATLERVQTLVLYQRGFIEDGFGVMTIGIPLGKVGIGVGFSYYNAGKIELLSTEGNTYTFNAQKDHLFSFGVSANPFSRYYLGMAAKFLTSTLVEKFTATAFAFDFGALIELWDKRMLLGACYRNLGEGIKYHKKRHPLPTQIRAGALIKVVNQPIHRLALFIDVVDEEGKTKKNFGIKYALKDILYLRFGYKLGYDLDKFSGGFGLKKDWFSIDYAFCPKGELGNNWKVSITLEFGRI